MHRMIRRVALASSSPQRRAILTQLGIPHRLITASVEEIDMGTDPRRVALENARLKAAAAIGETAEDEVLLTCDTVVDIAGQILGKPANADQARQMIGQLAGRTHLVHSAVVLVNGGDHADRWESIDTTAVTCSDVGGAVLDRYIATGEWSGRAGGYAIQGHGAVLVDSVRGDWWTVVGLPVAALTSHFTRHGLDHLLLAGEAGGEAR